MQNFLNGYQPRTLEVGTTKKKLISNNNNNNNNNEAYH